MKNRPVFTLNPQGEQAGFSAFTPWGRGKKAEKPCWILICQSRTNITCKLDTTTCSLTFYIDFTFSILIVSLEILCNFQ
jgi:hypothetical protein